MPDWQELVRQRLAGLALEPCDTEEVVTELAGHLEEVYESLRAHGNSNQEAMRRALAQVTDWQELQRKILTARREHPMRQRVHQLWIPGFLTLILSMVLLVTLQNLGFHPRIVSSGPKTILFYGLWLLSLPFVGGLGTYVSARAGGSRRTMLFASIFPVLALTTAFLLMFPIGWIASRIIGRSVDFSTVATSILRDGIGWILFPGVALLTGGLLVHLSLSPPASRETVIG